MKKGFCFALIAALLATSIGCGNVNSGSKTDATTVPNASNSGTNMKDPITLNIYQRWAQNDVEFKLYYQDPLQKIFPNVTLQLLRPKNLEELLSSGQVPDFIEDWNGNFSLNNDNGLLQDMTPLVKKHNVDIGQFDQAYINALRDNQSSMLYGIPLYSQFNALYYNKDIFDKFGVPYPKDGMTWNDTFELAKKLTRNVDGVQYTGLNYDNFDRLHMPFSINMIDPKTGKPNVNTTQWKELFELGNTIHNMAPNTLPTGGGNFPKLTIAMTTGVNMIGVMDQAEKAGVNWDIAQFPYHPQLPNVANQVDIHALFIPKGSTHPDEAMEVIKVLTSKEIQMSLAKDFGQMTVLADSGVKNSFGQNVPILKGKHIDGITKSKVSPYPTPTKYDGQIRNIIKKYYNDYVTGKIPDANTALRQAQDEADKYLESVKK